MQAEKHKTKQSNSEMSLEAFFIPSPHRYGLYLNGFSAVTVNGKHTALHKGGRVRRFKHCGKAFSEFFNDYLASLDTDDSDDNYETIAPTSDDDEDDDFMALLNDI